MGSCKTKEINGNRYKCYFELAMCVLSGKWKAIIVYHLAETGVMRFSELKRSMPEITERMLSKQLKELETDRLINRRIYNQVPPKVEYSLTEIGDKLIPILNRMRDWGVEYEEYMGADVRYASEGYEQPPEKTPAV
ncbi:MAG: winged helix-turn-helix transcriptional regulator [Deferribacterales bacterium]